MIPRALIAAPLAFPLLATGRPAPDELVFAPREGLSLVKTFRAVQENEHESTSDGRSSESSSTAERIGTGQMSECYRVALDYACGDGPDSVRDVPGSFGGGKCRHSTNLEQLRAIHDHRCDPSHPVVLAGPADIDLPSGPGAASSGPRRQVPWRGGRPVVGAGTGADPAGCHRNASVGGQGVHRRSDSTSPP